jgi:hypothetical protein
MERMEPTGLLEQPVLLVRKELLVTPAVSERKARKVIRVQLVQREQSVLLGCKD